MIPFLVQFWMFATPTVYMQPPENASGVIAVLIWANPMTGLVGGFRAACLGLPIPWAQLAVSTAAVRRRRRRVDRVLPQGRGRLRGHHLNCPTRTDFLRSQWIAFASA